MSTSEGDGAGASTDFEPMGTVRPWSPVYSEMVTVTALVPLTVMVWLWVQSISAFDHPFVWLFAAAAGSALLGLAIPRRSGTAQLRRWRRIRTAVALAFVGSFLMGSYMAVEMLAACGVMRD